MFAKKVDAQEDAATVCPCFLLVAHILPDLPDHIVKNLGKGWKERRNFR